MHILFEILAVACAIWVIYDVWTNSTKDTGTKILLTVLAILFSVITAIVYSLTNKKP